MTARSRDDTSPATLRGNIARAGRVGRSVESRSTDLPRVGWNFETATRRSGKGSFPRDACLLAPLPVRRFYVYDRAPDGPRSADEIVFRRWLCSCGQGGYALDAATFRGLVLSHWQATHGRAPATVVADLRPCTDELLAFVERQVLG